MTLCDPSKDTLERERHYANANAGVKYGEATLPPFTDELALIWSIAVLTTCYRRSTRTHNTYPLSMPIIPLKHLPKANVRAIRQRRI